MDRSLSLFSTVLSMPVVLGFIRPREISFKQFGILKLVEMLRFYFTMIIVRKSSRLLERCTNSWFETLDGFAVMGLRAGHAA